MAAISCDGRGPELAWSTDGLVASFSIVDDVRLVESLPDQNFEGAERIPIYARGDDESLLSYAALRFQIDPEAEPPIPSGALVERATLTLQLARNCGAGTRVVVRRLPIDWDPDTATWNCASVVGATSGCGGGTAWGDLDSFPQVAEVTCPSAPLTSVLAIDVTADMAAWAAEWAAGGEPHHGWVVSAAGLGTLRVHASESPFFGPTLSVTYTTDGIHVPASPAAPPLDRAAVSNVYDSYRFIFDPAAVPGSGPQNPQLGVAPGAIDPDRAAHLRGSTRVLEGLAPLSGVSVEVRGVPSMGRAYTRADGVWDMVINGGGPLTLIFRRPGYLEVHRNIDVAWGDDLAVTDVVMTPEPSRCTPTLLGGSTGFFTGSEACEGGACSAAGSNGWTTTDERGTRSMGIYLPPGVSVPGPGGPNDASPYRVCMVEYTQGSDEDGGDTREGGMPADVAANTAYTFAAEGQIRRVSDPGALGVLDEEATFDGPGAFLYVRSDLWRGEMDDLDFPVGTALPVGTFSRARSAWEPEHDGVVLEIVCPTSGPPAVSSGAVELPPDEAIALCASGMIGNGATARFWRVPVRHFSPLDINLLAAGIRSAAGTPIPPDASRGGASTPDGNGDDSNSCAGGSVIHCEGRAVGEMVPITGTDASLVYHSAHHRGRGELYTVHVRPVGTTADAEIIEDETVAVSTVFIGGRRLGAVAFDADQLRSLSAQDVVWDGLDAFGRAVNGPRFAQIRTVFTTPTAYCRFPEGVARRFGLGAAELECDGVGAGIVRLTVNARAMIGTIDDSGRGIGGWALSVQHTYDPATRHLYYGTGQRRSVTSVGATATRLRTLDGTTVPGLPTNASFRGMAHGPDGTLYFTVTGGVGVFDPDPGEGLYRIAPDGTLVQMADDLADARGVAVARDGTVWVADGARGCVLRYPSDAVAPSSGELMVGECRTGSATFPPNGGVPEGGVLDALAVRVFDVELIAAARDGSVWITAHTNSSSTSALLRWRSDGDAGLVDVPLENARISGSAFGEVLGMTAEADAMLLDLSLGGSARQVVRIGPDGSIVSFMGGSSGMFTPDDVVDRRSVRLGAAYEGSLSVDSRGRVYYRQQVLGAGGIPGAGESIGRSEGELVETFAGPPRADDGPYDHLCAVTEPGALGVSGSVPARRVIITSLFQFALRPQGGVLAFVGCDGGLGSATLFLFDTPFEGSIEVPHEVASEDRSELYEFDAAGRHLRTRDPLSRHVLRSFEYATDGRLTRYVDREGAITAFSYTGRQIRITAPGGLVTTVELPASPGVVPNTADYARRIVAPDGRSWSVTHDLTPGRRGLLRFFRAPGEVQDHVFDYDSGGRLRLDRDASDNGGMQPEQQLTEATGVALQSALLDGPQENLRQVTLTSAEGRRRGYAMRRRGSTLWSRRDLPSRPDAPSLFSESLDLGAARGLSMHRGFDGTLVSMEQAADPVYGTQAPYVSRVRVCRPSAQSEGQRTCGDEGQLYAEVTRERRAPSAQVLEQSTTVNGDTWTVQHDATARTRTLTMPNGLEVRLQLDAEGRVTRVEAPDQYPVCLTYQGHRIASIRQGRYDTCSASNPSRRRMVSFGYSTGGRRWLEDVSAGYGGARSTVDLTPLPNRGLVAEALLPGRTETATFVYDGEGRVTAIEPAGHSTSTNYRYTYTGRGSFDSESTPGVGGFPRLPAETSDTTYSPDGLLISQSYRGTLGIDIEREPETGYATAIHAGTDDLEITSDALGRPTEIDWTGPATGTFGYGYDGALMTSESVGLTDQVWTLQRVVSPTTARLDAEIVQNDSELGRFTETALRYAVDPGALFDGMTPFFSASVDRRFPVDLHDPPGTSPSYVSPIGLALAGQTGSTTLSDTSISEVLVATVTGGGLETRFGASAWGELSDVSTLEQGEVLWFRDQICERDEQGRILRRLETYLEPDGARGTRPRQLRWVYLYDARDRLSFAQAFRHNGAATCATRTGGTVVSGAAAFTYDVNTGNRTFPGSTYNGDDQLMSEGTGASRRTYTHDGRGRRATMSRVGAGGPTTTYGWDTIGHLRSTTTTGGATTRYQYDPAGRLIAIRNGTPSEDEFFVYRDGLEPVAWSRGNVRQYYVYGTQPHVPDLIYEDRDNDVDVDAVYRVITDERGSVRMLLRVDDVGAGITIAQQIEYDVWGEPRFVVGAEYAQPFGFAGAIWLRSARLWHMGAREYDPRLGRWISKDPIRFAGGTNLYVYCENDPINYVDVTGANGTLLGRAFAFIGIHVGAWFAGGAVGGAVAGLTVASSGGSADAIRDASIAGFVGGFLATMLFDIFDSMEMNPYYSTFLSACVGGAATEATAQALAGGGGNWPRILAAGGVNGALATTLTAVLENRPILQDEWRALPSPVKAVLLEVAVSGVQGGILAARDVASR